MSNRFTYCYFGGQTAFLHEPCVRTVGMRDGIAWKTSDSFFATNMAEALFRKKKGF